ncbi:MAG: hypothetical protein ABI551_20775 [Polyangiaceae bacterium]
MKPGEHPEFFRFPAPEGRSRESTIRLDAEGHFFHEGERVEHSKLAASMHTWISRHPDDGRFILTNGYDWTYFTVEDAPFVVRSIDVTDDDVVLLLSDGTEETWAPEMTRVAASGALYTKVKRGKEVGVAGSKMVPAEFEAKFSRHAQLALAPYLRDAAEDGSGLSIQLKNRTFGVPS